MQVDYDEVHIDYSTELKEDSILEVIKDACFQYLEYDEIKYTKDEFEYLLSFSYKKFDEMSKLKSQMKIKKYSHLAFEISSSLDKLTLSDSILEEDKNCNYFTLTKDLNNILVQLRFCIGILNKIILTLNTSEI